MQKSTPLDCLYRLLSPQIGAPSGLLTPNPTPTAIPTINSPIAILTAMRVRRLSDAMHVHVCLSLLASFALRIHSFRGGHMALSERPALRLPDSVGMIASRSVSQASPEVRPPGDGGMALVTSTTCVFSGVGRRVAELVLREESEGLGLGSFGLGIM